MTDEVPETDEDPLLAALREENVRLRAQNKLLVDQMSAARLAQEALAKHLRVTAPLRQIQESLRLRAGQRRRKVAAPPGKDVCRRCPRSPRPFPPSSSPTTRLPGIPCSAGPETGWPEQPLLPAPDIRPLRAGRSGRVLVVVHVFYPELWPALAERIQRIPVPVDLVVTLVEGRSEAPG